MNGRLRSSIWPYVVLVAAAAIFFRRVLFEPGRYTIPWDFEYYAYNQMAFLAQSFAKGHLPLWDPYTYCGMAFFANIQSQVFYPPSLLTALAAVAAGVQHLRFFMAIELAAHVAAAGVFTYWLLRALGCVRGAAVLGAIALELGCFFASQTQHFGAITGAAWVPLNLLAVVELGRHWRARWFAVLALSLAAPILAGYPSAIFPAFFLTAVLAIALVLCRRAALSLWLSTAGAALLAFGIAAIQLFPTLQIAAVSVSRYRGDWRHAANGIRLEALPSLVWPNYFHILDLKGYSLPYNFTFLYLYCGLTPLALAGAALAPRRNRYALPFAVVWAASAVIMFGDAMWPGRLLMPLFLNATRDTVYPEFAMIGFSLGLAVLAGLGADRLRAHGAVLAGLAVLTCADLTWFGSSRPMNTRALAEEPGITAQYFDGSPRLLETLHDLTNQQKPAARVETYQGEMGFSSMSPTIELPTANGNDPFALIRYMKVRRLFTGGTRWGRYYEVSDLASPVLDLLDIRYIISRRPLPEQAKYRTRAELAGRVVSENKAALPRFFLVRRIAEAANEDDGIAQMQQPGYAPGELAVVQGMASRTYDEGETPAVHVLRYDQNRVELETDAEQARFLVTSEAEYWGWEATVDGAATPIRLTNVAFRGLEIPGGHHRITFVYRPQVLLWGGLVSALSLLGCAVCWAEISGLRATPTRERQRPAAESGAESVISSWRA